MFAIADTSISIQHLHYERKYRYVKSYVTIGHCHSRIWK